MLQKRAAPIVSLQPLACKAHPSLLVTQGLLAHSRTLSSHHSLPFINTTLVSILPQYCRRPCSIFSHSPSIFKRASPFRIFLLSRLALKAALNLCRNLTFGCFNTDHLQCDLQVSAHHLASIARYFHLCSQPVLDSSLCFTPEICLARRKSWQDEDNLFTLRPHLVHFSIEHSTKSTCF